MKNRINLLSEDIWNKIAAGEVIERPFSVVKELVENSIDAEAKNINVQIQDGGETLIKVLDDGNGIYSSDIETAFLSHATSKIKSEEDMFKINTLGFRGEALPSIASISKVLMKSKTKDMDFGKEILIEGGEKKYIKDIGFNDGTCVEVRDLFFNVPARKKFLKSSQRESALISDIIQRLALVNSNISFKLESNNRKLINTYGNNNIEDTIRCIYGKETVKNMWHFEKCTDIASVYGYIGNADISKKSRNNQSIFVNKRYIKSSLITAAVEKAFKSFLTVNKFPFFILFIDIYPEFIDVNVHPTKSEIKFTNDRQIFKLVFDSVHESIAKNLKDTFFIDDNDDNIESKLDNKTNDNLIQVEQTVFDKDKFKEKQIKKTENLNKTDDFNKINDFNKTNFGTIKIEENPKDNLKNIIADDFRYELKKDNYNLEKKSYENQKNTYNNEDNKDTIIKEEQDEVYKNEFPNLKIIGQFNNTYILCEHNNELYIIDQHAAHEKILFEKYLKEINDNNVIIQGLLAPLILDLSYDDFSYYKDNEDVFKKIGFVIDEFGVNSIYIREVPIILDEKNVRQLFFDILNNLKDMGSGKIKEVKYNKIATMACKAAVKANDKLSLIEMQSLLDDLKNLNQPFNCPHGRPTIIKITLNELEKRFKRIQ